MSNFNTSLKEFLGVNNIFDIITTLGVFPFIEGDTVIIDTMLKLGHGNKIMADGYGDLTVENYANLVVKLNGDTWNKQFVEVSKINLGSDYTKTTESTSDDNNSRIDNGGVTHNVSAFNSNDLVAEYSDVKNGGETIISNNVGEVSESKNSLKSLFNNLPLIVKNNIINTVINDVANFGTLRIY